MRRTDEFSPGTSVEHKSIPLPAYMEEVYDWAYVNPRNVNKLDHNWIVKTLLFGNDQRLMRAYLNEIEPGQRVWQVAHVYGDLVRRVAQKIGEHGYFELTDVTQIQIEHAKQKLAGVPQAHINHIDAADWQGGSYDLVSSFFLLHEIPEEKKYEVVASMLRALRPGGKLVFVDYHRPHWWQPIGWILRGVNAWLEPFAHALWVNEIEHYAPQNTLVWSKRTIFGGVYQIVTACAPSKT